MSGEKTPPPVSPPNVSRSAIDKELSSPQVNDEIIKYVVYKYRWVILTLYCSSTFLNAIHWLQYTIIQDVLVLYYGVSRIVLYWTSMITMLAYLIFMPPGCIFLTRTDLRMTSILGVVFTCLGSWLKVFSVPRHLFWLGFTGQILVSIAGIFIYNIPPRLAAVWFGPGQVSSACSIGVLGDQLGVAVGFVVPPMMVQATSTIEQTASELSSMFYMVAGMTTALTVLIIIFFKAAPPTPPSAAVQFSNTLEPNFLKSMKNLFTNRNYMLLLISYALNLGTFYAISTALNQTAHKDAGRIGLVMVVAGMTGSVICGVILDKTQRYKETTLTVYVAYFVGLLIFTFTLNCGYISVVYFSSSILGFFTRGYLPVGFEFASEITYPEPEGNSSGLLNCAVQLFGILITLLYEWMLTVTGDLWSNLTLCALLGVGTVITAAIRSDLRRLAAQRSCNSIAT